MQTNDQPHAIWIPPKSVRFGSSAIGGELLFLALASCYCNDIYRGGQARPRDGTEDNTMRKVILAMQITLDGFVGGPNGEMDWVTFSQEMDDTLLPEMMERADTCLIGRVLYQGFASYWPTAPQTNPNLSKSEVKFSKWIQEAQKIVFSTTLDKAEWNNSRLVRGDPAREVARLKQQPGKDMVIFGGARLAQQFVRLGLIDEYGLLINPVILGQGLPLFKDVPGPRKLNLVSCDAFESMSVALRYTPAGGS